MSEFIEPGVNEIPPAPKVKGTQIYMTTMGSFIVICLTEMEAWRLRTRYDTVMGAYSVGPVIPTETTEGLRYRFGVRTLRDDVSILI